MAKATWSLDPAHAVIQVAAKHMMMMSVRGQFSGVSGTITIDSDNPDRSSVEAEIDAASLDTRVEQRDQHLRSADFLDVEKFEKITFRSKRIDGAFKEPGASFQVVGDLTIRDVTREVVLDTTYEGKGRDPWGNDRVAFTASTRIDRRDYGLTWNQALETGGVLVGNELKITVEVEAIAALGSAVS